MAEKKLSKYDLLALSVGQVIGAGVITLIGPAINMTGRSAWISYLLAVLLGAIVTLPYTIAASTLKFNGGEYYLNVRLGGTLKGGMYITAYITQAISVSLMGTPWARTSAPSSRCSTSRWWPWWPLPCSTS